MPVKDCSARVRPGIVRSQGSRLGVALAIALVLSGSVAPIVSAGGPVTKPPTFDSLTPEQVLKTLGPGPLAPRPAPDSMTAQSKDTDLAARIDQCMQSNIDALDVPGAAVAVMLEGEILYSSGYGVKHRQQGGAVDAETVFRIGSVTKQMTAAAVLQQVELGRVELDAPVTRYIPEFEISGRWPADQITVWNLLTHTTGFPDHFDNVTRSDDGALSWWAATQDEVELHAPPGSFWNYSNPNFALAGLVAERASGTPYRELYESELWEPAGMNSTTFDPSEVVDSGNYSFGHYWDVEGQRESIFSPRANDLWAAGPAGFAFSTVSDLVHWALLLMDGGGSVLAPSSAARMQERQAWTNYTPDLFYGFGIMIQDYGVLDIRQHGGNVAGYGTYLLWVPEHRFAVATLANVTSSLIDAAYCVVDVVLPQPPIEPPSYLTAPSTWDRYAGHYDVTTSESELIDADVTLEGEHLMAVLTEVLDPSNTLTVELEQLYLDTFAFDADGNGTYDDQLTFCTRTGNPGWVMWLRNRYAVGERSQEPRAGGITVRP